MPTILSAPSRRPSSRPPTPQSPRLAHLSHHPHPTIPARLAFIAIAVAAFAWRLVDLAAPSLWFDELLELERALLPWPELLRGRGVDQDPALFSVVMRGWLVLVGNASGPPVSEFLVRIPAVLMGTAAVFLGGHWAARRFGVAIGLLTASLLAVAPVLVHYSREVNQYAAMVLLTIVALISWDHVRGAWSRRAWIGHGVVTAIGLATHYGLVFPLALMGMDLLLTARREGRSLRPVVVYASVVGVVLAMLIAMGLGSRLDIGHVQKRFGGTHLQKEVDYILDVGWREVLVFYLLPFSGGKALVAVRVMGLLMAVGAIALWREAPAGKRVVGGILGGGLVLTYIGSLFGLYPLGFRHGLFHTPLLTVCLAAGVLWVGRVARIRRARVMAPLVAGALMGSTLMTFVYFAPHARWQNPWLGVPREEARPVLQGVTAAWMPDDRLWVYSGAQPAYRWYGLAMSGLPPAWGAATSGDVATTDRADAVSAIAAGPQPPRLAPPYDSRDAAAVAMEAARILAMAEDGAGVWLFWSHVNAADHAAMETALAILPLIQERRVEADGAFAVRLVKRRP